MLQHVSNTYCGHHQRATILQRQQAAYHMSIDGKHIYLSFI